MSEEETKVETKVDSLRSQSFPTGKIQFTTRIDGDGWAAQVQVHSAEDIEQVHANYKKAVEAISGVTSELYIASREEGLI